MEDITNDNKLEEPLVQPSNCRLKRRGRPPKTQEVKENQSLETQIDNNLIKKTKTVTQRKLLKNGEYKLYQVNQVKYVKQTKDIIANYKNIRKEIKDIIRYANNIQLDEIYNLILKYKRILVDVPIVQPTADTPSL